MEDEDEEEHYQGEDEGEKGGRGRPRKNGVSSGGVAQFIRGLLYSITFATFIRMLIVVIFATFTFTVSANHDSCYQNHTKMTKNPHKI